MNGFKRNIINQPVPVCLNFGNATTTTAGVFQRTDLCTEEKVTFVNNGPCPVSVALVSDDPPSPVVQVEPEQFEVVGRSEISVRVTPDSPGRLRHTLRFRAENRDGRSGETFVYVRGTVEQSAQVYARPTMTAWTGTVCAGTPATYGVQLSVKSSGPFCVQRRLYELDGRSGTLSSHGVDKSFGPYGAHSPFLKITDLYFDVPLKTDVSRNAYFIVIPHVINTLMPR